MRVCMQAGEQVRMCVYARVGMCAGVCACRGVCMYACIGAYVWGLEQKKRIGKATQNESETESKDPRKSAEIRQK